MPRAVRPAQMWGEGCGLSAVPPPPPPARPPTHQFPLIASLPPTAHEQPSRGAPALQDTSRGSSAHTIE
jgi:hypothetical protein